MVTLSLALPVLMAPDIAQAQSINCFQPISFGTLIPCAATADTVRISPSTGVATAGSCVGTMGTPLRARCTLKGQYIPVPMQVTIATPVVVLSNGTANMNLDNLDWNATGQGGTITVTAYVTVINLGGTLHVGAAQNAGSYSGSFTATVNYQ